jgi:putative transposase
MTFRPELIDELLKDYRNPSDLMGEGGIFNQLSKALIERCLNAELETHLEKERLEAEAALRTAQLELHKQQKWHSPYYWAAFTLQGEWK